jgi:hypothetical protein
MVGVLVEKKVERLVELSAAPTVVLKVDWTVVLTGLYLAVEMAELSVVLWVAMKEYEMVG